MSIIERALELEVTDQLLAVLDDPAVAMAEGIYEEPVQAYTNENRFAVEREQLFGRTPLMAALSGELPEPGSWKLFDDTGVPIILIRGDDGLARGFLNVCQHRGARVVEEERGTARRLSCPFHAWSYNTDGTLGTVPARQAFTGMCQEDRGLTPVEVQERYGAIWVVAKPGPSPIDLDAHLGPFAAELSRWDMGSWHLGEKRVHTVDSNWKVAMDTFTESYHVPVLHKNTIGALAVGSASVHQAFGDHHRWATPMQGFLTIHDKPREQWQPFDEWMFALIYIVYPNTAFMITGTHAEMYQTFPGATVGTSFVNHSVFSFEPILTDEIRAHYSQQLDFFFDFTDNEDFRVCRGVEKGLRSNAMSTFVFGRNEPTTQRIHRSYQRDVDFAMGLDTAERPRLATAGN